MVKIVFYYFGVSAVLITWPPIAS